jgi:hypothetical protein
MRPQRSRRPTPDAYQDCDAGLRRQTPIVLAVSQIRTPTAGAPQSVINTPPPMQKGRIRIAVDPRGFVRDENEVRIHAFDLALVRFRQVFNLC